MINYLYSHNAMCEVDPVTKTTGYCIDVKPDFIVHNVQAHAGGYSFNIEGLDKTYWSFYAWAFVQTDEANLQAYRKYCELRLVADLAHEAAEEALSLVRNVEIPQKLVQTTKD